MNDVLPVAPSEALLQEIERQAMDEERAIAESAAREGQAVIAQAYADAGRRVHDAIADMRRERADRLRRATARLETEARRNAQRRAIEAIRQAWPQLMDALNARWTDSTARGKWVESIVSQARGRLREREWLIEHPTDWSAADEQHFRDALGRELNLAFAADSALSAGLRIRAGEATLDATPQGLVSDCAAITALFLAEIAGGRR